MLSSLKSFSPSQDLETLVEPKAIACKLSSRFAQSEGLFKPLHNQHDMTSVVKKHINIKNFF